MRFDIGRFRKIEFEYRIFISFGIAIMVGGPCLLILSRTPTVASLLGGWAGLEPGTARAAGYVTVTFSLVLASLLRMWAGSVLTSRTMMAFPVQHDWLAGNGPYRIVRNPIYLADLIALWGIAFCLPWPAVLIPALLWFHYIQLIKYEEGTLSCRFGERYEEYLASVPFLFPSPRRLRKTVSAMGEFRINRDGMRHDALYVMFIPGFALAAVTGRLWVAALVGVPTLVDWAIIHTKIGLSAKAKIETAEKRASGFKNRKKGVFDDILYSQCWEDPDIDREAFRINDRDVVFSITSGGCNVLTFLLDNPRRIIALDINPRQNYLLDLKMAAFRGLSYEELLEFVGVRESNRRSDLYIRVRPSLHGDSRIYWDNQPIKIEGGIIHCGRFEGYLRLLRIWANRLMGKRLIRQLLLTDDAHLRAELFRRRWDNIRWRLLTRVLLSRRVMTLLFDKAFFSYLDDSFSFGKHFAAIVERALTELPVRQNYFLSYMLLGGFSLKRSDGSEAAFPHYLRRENYDIIRSRLDRVELVSGNCRDYFATLPDNTISKFNFSNIFEWVSPEDHENLLRSVLRVGRDGAIITYRNLLVPRERPDSLGARIFPRRASAERLHQRDLSFIYRKYVVEEIRKDGDSCLTRSKQYAIDAQ